jgi:hypothetical protein
MPIGVTLDRMRVELRAETGQSINYTLHGVESQKTQDIVLDRQQRELWDAYNWEHLRIHKDVTLANGQADYSYPAEIQFDQISRINLAQSGSSQWQTLTYGIRATDIPPGGAPRGTPRQWANKVAVSSAGVTDPTGMMITLLPVPNVDGMVMRIAGQAPCTSLNSSEARCIIDSKAIILFAAAEILATQKSESAALKLTKAQNYLRKLLINSGADKRSNYNMGGAGRVDHLAVRPYANVPGIGYIP